ncbi:helix-turn-helix domain-containing protein [Aphanothece sacrum]|uniref:DNA-binding protein n=1 Tax=Aphanothece sacrum FPU1 TaxID=1920663 RepID=A0A401IHN4_APHSA|nr:RodZ domain-containing protein [Aphanothece sacrum]GBF80778.1 DNA-binding protein [Aphanothece sacrum FPU1]GBF83273.1 DNA-binding protein [Aphanothece sacrum FPU3]
MSSQKPPLNSSQSQSNRSLDYLGHSSSEERSQLQKLWAKLLLNHSLPVNHTEKEPENLPKIKLSPRLSLKFLKQLWAKLPRRKKPSYDPRQLQQEILADIGRELYQVRREHRLSLEEIAIETRISVGLLQAIEKGRLEDLPEAIYTRGLIKKFADFLGLDGATLAYRFPTDIVLKSSPSSRFNLGLPGLQLRPLHLYFLYIIIVILSVQGISNSLKRSAFEMRLKEVVPPSSVPSLPVQASPTPVIPSQTGQKPVRVNLQIRGKSSLKIVADGKTVFQGVLETETQQNWMAQKTLTLDVDNAGLIIVKFNEEPPQRLGKLGEAKRITYQSPKTFKNTPKPD